MIPLSLWLADDRLHSLASDVPSILELGRDWLAERDGSLNIEVQLAAAREQALGQGRGEAEAMVAAAREEENAKSMAREANLTAKWSARCVALAETGFTNLRLELHAAIGDALNDVLRAFLPDAARQRALAQLFEFLDRELAAAGGELLELRLPGELHEDFRRMLERKSIAVVLTESETIEMLTRHAASRFESLAESWIERIRAGAS